MDSIEEKLNNKAFNYGDIILVSHNNIINNNLCEDLSRIGVALRFYRGDKTNLDSIIDYDNTLREYIKQRQLGNNISLLSESNKRGLSYTNICNYIKDGRLLSKCNNNLYKLLLEVKNNNNNKVEEQKTSSSTKSSDIILNDIRGICNKHNLSMVELTCLMIPNIECSKVKTTRKKLNKDEKHKICLELVKDYVNTKTNKSLKDLANQYDISYDIVSHFVSVTLLELDVDLYARYKDKATAKINRKVHGNVKSSEVKLDIVKRYIESDEGISLHSLCNKYGISATTLLLYIRKELKTQNKDLYYKYKDKVSKNRLIR